MGTELFKGFGVDIAAQINSSLGPGIPSATLVSRVAGALDTDDLSAGVTYTETSNACKAFLDTFDNRRYQSDAIESGTRVIVIIGDSLPSGVIPKTEDRIIAEGQTFHLTGPVVRDPAAATYVCEVRA